MKCKISTKLVLKKKHCMKSAVDGIIFGLSEIIMCLLNKTSRFKKFFTSIIYLQRQMQIVRSICVLGIETSCDDTGIAIVDDNCQVLANVLDSQQDIHTRYGGIIPPRAQDLHRHRIYKVFERCMNDAKMTTENIDAIAVTTEPGLPLSLAVGLRFAKHLGRMYKKPIIPIHHMEAHALQARMEYQMISFPFLCLLISGGHCQLTFVQSPFKFLLLGETLDDAPGEAFDKIARRLRLFIIPKYRLWNGGHAIEEASKMATNPNFFEFPLPLSHIRNCQFSFAGIKNNSFRAIKAAEVKETTPPDGLIKNYADFCAGLLQASSRHLMHRTQRALEFCISKNLFGTSKRFLVVSGGVANNDYIYNDIHHLANQYGCETYRPSKKYCSDNGVMIGWNGIEKLQTDVSCLRWDYEHIHENGRARLGENIMDDVQAANIKCKWVKGFNS